MWRAIRPDSISVWSNEQVLTRLKRYYAVLKDEKPAKMLVARKVEIEDDLNVPTDKLWHQHQRASGKFRSLLKEVDQGKINLKDLDTPKTSYLDLKLELARRILASCHFCERRCGVNRLEGKHGACQLNAKAYVSSAFLHFGEEAPLVPSGTNARVSLWRCNLLQHVHV
ncbi:MAG: hypothetical protein QXQ21_02665 [Candidatus Jordarchaeales archaeon]